MITMCLLVFWGMITILAFGVSAVEYVSDKRKEYTDSDYDYRSKSTNTVAAILVFSIVSAVFFILAAILFMYFLLILSVEKPLLDKLLTAISCWPFISLALIILAMELEIKSAARPKLKNYGTAMIVLSIASVIAYCLFYGGVLYFALNH